MGGLLSTRRAGTKRKHKQHAPRQDSSSSSSISPNKYPTRAHTFEPQTRISKGNVQGKMKMFNKLDEQASQHHKPTMSSSHNTKTTKTKGFDYKVDRRSKHENVVTIDLDIPRLTSSQHHHHCHRPNATSSKATPSKMPTKKEFEEACIKAHNQFRSCHGSRPLERDSKLTSMAQEWANKLAKAGKLQHSTNKGYGENVAFTSKDEPSGLEICKMWYDEIKDYNFRSPGFAGNTGHFTQVVWKGTTHVGVGIATGSKEARSVGNISGRYEQQNCSICYYHQTLNTYLNDRPQVDSGTFVVANYKPSGNITNPGYFKENVGKQTSKPKFVERRRSSSSSSSSSSDDDCSRRKSKSGAVGKTSSGAPKPGKTVDTKTEIYTENGVRKKKTIVTTTTVTVTSKGTQTSTQTQTKIETLPDDGKSTSSLGDKFKKLRTRRDSSSSSSSSSDDDDGGKNVMSSSDIKKFRKECLERHNELRRRHGAPKLKENKKLQEAAQRHAKRMLRREKLSHTDKKKYGENVAMKLPRPSGSEACDMWYDEKKDYDFKKAVFSGNTGHFTQVVWKDTTEIGVGIASDSKGKTYVACFYNPPGNVRGEFANNVKRA